MNDFDLILSSPELLHAYWESAMLATQLAVSTLLIGAVLGAIVGHATLVGSVRLRRAISAVSDVFRKMQPWVQCYYWVAILAWLGATSPMLLGVTLTLLLDISIRISIQWSMDFRLNQCLHSVSNNVHSNAYHRNINLRKILKGLDSVPSEVMRQYLLLILILCALSSPSVNLIFGASTEKAWDARTAAQSLAIFSCIYLGLYAFLRVLVVVAKRKISG